MKKNDPNKILISVKNQSREEIDDLKHPALRSTSVKNLDYLIASLSHLRTALTHSSVDAKVAEIRIPLEQVIAFLEFAKSDESLRVLLQVTQKNRNAKPKRQLIEIPNNLTNEQIRKLLEKDLSKAELKTIAGQRAISVGKSNKNEIKQYILKNLERQEGYGRLSSS